MHRRTVSRPRQRRTTATLAVALAACLAGAGLVVSPAVAADTGIVVNGDLETGQVAPWQGRVDAQLAITDDARTGEHALLVTDRTGTQSGPAQSVAGALEPDSVYSVTASVRYDTGPATRQFFITSFTGGSAYSNLAGVNATRGTWSTMTGTFTTGATIPATYDVFLETSWVSSAEVAANPANHVMDFLVDDVVITRTGGTEPTDPSDVVAKQPGDSNPLMTQRYGADPYAFVHDGRVYVYMTNDSQELDPNDPDHTNTYAKINQINVISSADLVNWTDHGSIQVAGPDGVATWATNSWAPGMASKVVDGKEQFFLYFCNNGGSSGVIVGDSPIGPWRDPIGKPLVNAQTPGASDGQNWLFDPAPFVDSDGQAYLYFGGGAVERDPNNPRSTRVIRLGEDMVSTVGEAEVIDAPQVFEASHVFERDGIYYYSYSSNFNGESRPEGYPGGGVIAYLMSDSPMGPWTPAQLPARNNGTVFQNPSTFFGVGGNNHQSFFELNGRHYLAYHAQTVNLALVGGVSSQVRGFRSTHIDEVTFAADGTMDLVQGTYAGVDQVQPLDVSGRVEAETIAWQKGMTTIPVDEPAGDGAAVNMALDKVDDGDWVALSQASLDGVGRLDAKVRVLAPGTSATVHLDTADGPQVGELTFDSAPGAWATVSTTLDDVEGEHDLYVVFHGDDADGGLVQVDAWTFGAGDGTTLDVTATAASRCLASRAMPTVTVVNGEDVPVTVTASAVGTTRTLTVQPGATAFHQFTHRAATLDAGTVTLDVSAGTGGTTTQLSAAYPAASCG